MEVAIKLSRAGLLLYRSRREMRTRIADLSGKLRHQALCHEASVLVQVERQALLHASNELILHIWAPEVARAGRALHPCRHWLFQSNFRRTSPRFTPL